MLSKGLLDKAKSNARFNIASVYPYVAQGAKLVGLEPSCILSFRDDYPDLVGDDPRARLVAENTMLAEEFVGYAQTELGAAMEFSKPPAKLLVHGHCHQKALARTQDAMDLLRSVPGCDPAEIESGCCGMAGSFGFEKEHYDVSMKIGEEALFPAIRSEDGDFAVVTDGVSCRQQIEHGTGKRARHLVEVLADAL
jgi:Fe-S oxidoreductase